MVVVPRRRPWRWVGIALVVLVAGSLLTSFVTNPNYEWPTVAHYLFDPRIMRGLINTLILTGVAMVIALALGLVLAIMKMSESALLSRTAGVYIWLFRGTPILVQLILWYNLAILLPEVGIGIPGVGTLWSAETNDLITPWTAAILGLGLNEAAYLAEILRSGITSVDKGQHEAATALGMRRSTTFVRIILPQAARVVVPPTFNEMVGLLKYSAVVSVIALPELLYSGQLIYARTYETIPVLIVVSIWYLAIVSVLTFAESRIERRLGAGYRPTVATSSKEGRWSRWMASANR